MVIRDISTSASSKVGMMCVATYESEDYYYKYEVYDTMTCRLIDGAGCWYLEITYLKNFAGMAYMCQSIWKTPEAVIQEHFRSKSRKNLIATIPIIA